MKTVVGDFALFGLYLAYTVLVDSRQLITYVVWSRARVSDVDIIARVTVDRNIECVVLCLASVSCMVTLFNKTSKECDLVSKNATSSTMSSPTERWYLTTVRENLMYMDDERDWHAAYDRCLADFHGLLWQVDNSRKQERAETLARKAGHQLLAIGVYFDSSKFSWMYSDDTTKVNYTNWADGHPQALPVGMFAAMKADEEYKWISYRDVRSVRKLPYICRVGMASVINCTVHPLE